MARRNRKGARGLERKNGETGAWHFTLGFLAAWLTMTGWPFGLAAGQETGGRRQESRVAVSGQLSAISDGREPWARTADRVPMCRDKTR